MPETAVSESRALLERSPDEREALDIGDDEVVDALFSVIEHGSQAEKVISDCTLPALNLDFRTIESDNNHPVVFRNCTFEGAVSAVDADVTVPISFENSDIGGLELSGARFEFDLSLSESTVSGDVDAFEARFDDQFDVTGSTFTGPVTLQEAHFGNDADFERASFEESVSFETASFSGASNELGDNASFEDATFEGEVDFRQAAFTYADFADVSVAGRVRFEETTFTGDVAFTRATFQSEADFDEVDFGGDVDFESVTFQGTAVFRGAEFEGGARSLEEDATFSQAVFDDELNACDAHFRDGLFDGITVNGRATFEGIRFDGDASFEAATFADEVDFDEARFYGDVSFEQVSFDGVAIFRGAEFRGADNHLEEDASFDAATFGARAGFEDAVFSSGSFVDTRFAAETTFRGAKFDRAVFHVVPITNESYVDFTRAIIKDGEIRQPEGGWVRYDLTNASLGSVSLRATTESDHRQLLDYFRFCNTEFNEFDGYHFDFSAHTDYLDRNDWSLHEFDENFADVTFALPMTPENVERTYLKAKTAASSAGQMKAAGEFRVRRQQFARKKYVGIARDGTTDLVTRAKNASRAVENAFLGVTCGHGMRLGRIVAVFALFPLFPAMLYAFGGSAFSTTIPPISGAPGLFSPEGLSILYRNVHFSYITFLTIGYGYIGPEGAAARAMAGMEVYVNVILSGLVLYCLIKRSEI
ncbi:pentapeptide repeat-containing protein [Halomicrobium sp. HM KBTZ05]|uniref:pentapeptide repeat-containing protein n=1 Tax=Halomicrobium sp. HM KBTZ05 TaxID=3242663 RepID=UPI00355811FC